MADARPDIVAPAVPAAAGAAAPDAASPNVPPGLVEVRVRAISCEAAMRRLWDYVDARLGEPARAETDAHLAECAGCPPHVAFAVKLKRALAASRGATS